MEKVYEYQCRSCQNKQYKITGVFDFHGLLDIYSCGLHAGYYCKICMLSDCNLAFIAIASDRGGYFRKYVYRDLISHFVINHMGIGAVDICINAAQHTFIRVKQCFVASLGKQYYGQRYININDMVDLCSYFIGLRPEFPFREIRITDLHMPAYDILSVARGKSFSCILCRDRFESFPSYELYNAHARKCVFRY